MRSEEKWPIITRLAPTAFTLLLLGAIAYAYAPSLKHLPRSDHWAYLGETVAHDDFAAIVAHTYSYSRTRMSFKGDTLLFRPLLFTLLAAEKAAFGPDFARWQTAGILLHVLICLLLLSLLRRLRAWAAPAGFSAVDVLPYALTFFFAVNPAVMEQVIWTHISGYLLFLVLELAALRLLLALVEQREMSPRRRSLLLAGVWLLALAAAFTYELGQFAAILIGLFLAVHALRQHGRRRAAAFLALFVAIAGIYQGVNLLDRWVHRETFTNDMQVRTVLERMPTSDTVQHAARYALFSGVQPFLPWQCPREVTPLGRMRVEETVWNHKLCWDTGAFLCLTVPALIGVLSLVGLARANGVRGPTRLFMALGLALAGCHAAIIIFGRMNVIYPWIILTVNSYYTYCTLLLLLLGAAAVLLHCDGRAPGPRWTMARIAAAGLALGLFAQGGAGLIATHQINREITAGTKPFHVWHDHVASFVRKHANEPDFRFAVLRSGGYHCHEVSGILLLHHRYLDTTRPKYVLQLGGAGRPRVFRTEEWRATHPGQEPDLYPDLIAMQPDYNVFRLRGRFYAVEYDHVMPFLDEPSCSYYRLVRRSLPELLERLKELRQAG